MAVLTRRRMPGLALIALAAVLLAGCSTAAPRPSLDAAVARYDEMLAAMRDDISGVLGQTDWSELSEASTTPGDHAYGEGAELAHSPLWSLPGVAYSELDAATRSTLLGGISDIAVEYGFTRLSLYIDTDDEVQAVSGDAIRTELQFSANTDVTLSYSTQSLIP